MLLAILFDLYIHRITCCCLTRLRSDAGHRRLASGGGCVHECVFNELPVGSGNRGKRCLNEDPAPRAAQPGRRCVETSDDVIEDDFISSPDSRIWDFSPMRLGAAKTARESAKSPAEPATICRALFYARVATFHHRADGTYVAPHYQTNPNHNPYDNWSTKGNYDL
jgi:hypothetical protein